MILKQYYLGCLSHASYLLGDEATQTAIIVDPQRDIQQYLEDAAALNLTIRHVFLTHFHADFIAGHLELRDATRATIHLGAQAKAEYPFKPMHDGDTLDFLNLRLQILETPGHTIESISILVFDLEKATAPNTVQTKSTLNSNRLKTLPEKGGRGLTKTTLQPHAVLTGDTLFIGDVGRPDLRASLGFTAAELGAHLYTSLHTKLLPLPDETLVYPGHGAGSLCGKQLSSDTVSTLGQQRRFNYALQPMSREAFLALVTADQPDAPPYFTYDAILNTRERATLTTTLAQGLQPLRLDQILTDQLLQLLDVRDPSEFATGHLPGAINIGLSGQYATWAGTILDRSKPIVLIAEPGREEEAALRLGRIGFDNVRGYLSGGMASAIVPLRTIDRISVHTAAEELASTSPPLLLDVRTPTEWSTSHIAGSLNIPLNHLQSRLTELPPGTPIAVHCAGGYRSSIAASILENSGITNLVEIAGGLAAWDAANLPTTTES